MIPTTVGHESYSPGSVLGTCNMIIRKVALGILLSSVAMSSTQAESINEALAAAYNHSPALNAQRAATRAQDEALPQAKAGYRPFVSANADIGIRNGGINSLGSSTTRPYGYGVSISQNLFLGFRTVNSIEAAEARIRASRENLRNVEQNALFNAAASYIDVVFAKDVVDIRRRNIRFLKEQLRSSQARLDVGEGTRTDVAQSQARLALGEAQLAAALATLEANRGTYIRFIGRAPSSLSWPKGPVRLYPKGLQEGLARGANENPALIASQHLVDAASFQVKVAEGALLPTVTLDAGAARSFNTDALGTRTRGVQATVNVTVPIYQRGEVTSQIRENKELLSQTRIQVDQTRDEVRSTVVTAWAALQSARANLNANTQQVRAARLALSGVIEERNVGQRTQLDVLDSQSDVLNAEDLVAQSRRSLATAGYQLVAATGRLNSRRLGLAVKHYSPKTNYNVVKDKWYGLRTVTGR